MIDIDWFSLIRNSTIIKERRRKRLSIALDKIKYTKNSLIVMLSPNSPTF